MYLHLTNSLPDVVSVIIGGVEVIDQVHSRLGGGGVNEEGRLCLFQSGRCVVTGAAPLRQDPLGFHYGPPLLNIGIGDLELEVGAVASIQVFLAFFVGNNQIRRQAPLGAGRVFIF